MKDERCIPNALAEARFALHPKPSRLFRGEQYIIILLLTYMIVSATVTYAKSTLVFATEVTYRPYIYMAASGEIKGFDADIVRAVCHVMKTHCVIKNLPWESLVPSLQLGKVDVIFGGLSVTNRRKKQVAFTHIYYRNTASLLARKDMHFTLSRESLKNRVIGVQQGTTFDIYLQAKYGNAVKIHRYASEQNACMDLLSGRIDAVLGDTPVIEAWLRQGTHAKQYMLVGGPIRDSEHLGRGYAFAIKKNNPELLHRLNQALYHIQSQKILPQIHHHYFSHP